MLIWGSNITNNNSRDNLNIYQPSLICILSRKKALATSLTTVMIFLPIGPRQRQTNRHSPTKYNIPSTIPSLRTCPPYNYITS